MNRNWDIMRNAANGADPYGTTRRMEQNRMRDRERWTSRERQEGLGGASYFDGVPDVAQGRYNEYRNEYRNERRGYVPSYGDEGFGRPSQGWGAQGYGGGEYHPHHEHQERERGFLGRLEEGIDRAFGNDWERQERYRGMRDMRGDEMRGDMRDRDDDHPSLWDRVKGAFTGGGLSGKGPKNWTRSDERIREDVCECLTYHPNIDASEIDVTVKDAEVTLTGTVFDRGSKRLAEDIVEGVRGVHDVHNQLRVQRQTAQGTTQSTSTTPGVGTTGSTGTMPTNQAWNQARR
jgi:hypothetical protein